MKVGRAWGGDETDKTEIIKVKAPKEQHRDTVTVEFTTNMTLARVSDPCVERRRDLDKEINNTEDILFLFYAIL